MGRKSREKRERQESTPPGRMVKMTSELKEAMEQQLDSFRERFGRDPGPEDPVFFDPFAEGNTPQRYSEETADKLRRAVAEAMSKAGIEPAIIYAYNKTGYLIREGLMDNFTAEQLQEYQDALDEYQRLEKGTKQ